MKESKKWLPLLLITVAFLVSGISVFIASQRPLTSLENTLLQAFSLAFGIIGSFYFGKQSATDAAKQIIKPHARSAFRRLISLYESLSRVGVEIENSKTVNMKLSLSQNWRQSLSNNLLLPMMPWRIGGILCLRRWKNSEVS